MKKICCMALNCLVLAVMLHQQAWSVDCPGFCIQCRSDANNVCGAGCVRSYSCSLSTCTCSFTCSGGCHPGGLSPNALLQDSLKLQVSTLKNANRSYATPDVPFNLVLQPDVPLAVTQVELGNDPGRQVSEITYTLKNDADFTLRGIRIMLVFFNDRGESLGAESLDERLSLVPRAEKVLRASLRNYVDSGQHVAIAVTDFETDAKSWHGDHAKIIKAMKEP